MGLLLTLLWSSPPLELALVDVARELRCMPDLAPREEALAQPCDLCDAATGGGVWLCVVCEARVSGRPEVCA